MTRVLKRTYIATATFAIILLAIYGSGLITHKKAEAGPPSGASKQSTTVETSVLSPARLDYTIKASGTVLANEEIDLKNEVAGRVVALNFKEGQPVQ